MRKPWARELPQDELSEDEIQDMHSPMYTEASDLEICRLADHGDPVADAIFYDWPPERRRAAAQSADKEDQEEWG
jgi:hypothetical protein